MISSNNERMKYLRLYKFHNVPDPSETIASEYEYKKSNFFEYKKYADTVSLCDIIDDILEHRTDHEYLKKHYGGISSNEDISTNCTGPVRVEFTGHNISSNVKVSINGEHYIHLVNKNISSTIMCKSLVDYTDKIHSSDDLRTAQGANSLKVCTLMNKLNFFDIEKEIIQHCIVDDLS